MGREQIRTCSSSVRHAQIDMIRSGHWFCLEAINMRQQSTQYSLAAVFYFVTLMALVFSAMAPFLRAITAKNRIAVLSYGSIQMGLIGVMVFGLMLSRARIQRLVRRGTLVHRTSFADQGPLGFWQSLKAIVVTIPAFLFLLCAGAAITAEPLSVVAFLHPIFLDFK